jgi:hypothetical protein
MLRQESVLNEMPTSKVVVLEGSHGARTTSETQGSSLW